MTTDPETPTARALLEAAWFEVPSRIGASENVGQAMAATPSGAELLRRADRPEARDERDEGRCDRCGGVNVVWWADHDLWNATGRTDGADEWPFLCPSCFATVAEERGVVPAATVWKMVPNGEVAQRTEPEVSTLQVAGSTPALPATHSLSNDCLGGECADCEDGSVPADRPEARVAEHKWEECTDGPDCPHPQCNADRPPEPDRTAALAERWDREVHGLRETKDPRNVALADGMAICAADVRRLLAATPEPVPVADGTVEG